VAFRLHVKFKILEQHRRARKLLVHGKCCDARQSPGCQLASKRWPCCIPYASHDQSSDDDLQKVLWQLGARFIHCHRIWLCWQRPGIRRYRRCWASSCCNVLLHGCYFCRASACEGYLRMRCCVVRRDKEMRQQPVRCAILYGWLGVSVSGEVHMPLFADVYRLGFCRCPCVLDIRMRAMCVHVCMCAL
jgi:hypothetical protein